MNLEVLRQLHAIVSCSLFENEFRLASLPYLEIRYDPTIEGDLAVDDETGDTIFVGNVEILAVALNNIQQTGGIWNKKPDTAESILGLTEEEIENLATLEIEPLLTLLTQMIQKQTH